MFGNPRKRAAREFEVAIHYLLHDAEKLVPLLKKTYEDKWSGFIDAVVNGARPYEEATVLMFIFLQQSFRDLDQARHDAIISDIANKNLVNPSNLLRIIGQVACLLYLAEGIGNVRESYWTGWVRDTSRVFAETGEVTPDQCSTYLIALANSYRAEIHRRKSAS
jgi:hypothetical protein